MNNINDWLNDFILHGETLSSKASLQVFHENTYPKKMQKNYTKNTKTSTIYKNLLQGDI